jgi:hypothetical protein
MFQRENQKCFEETKKVSEKTIKPEEFQKSSRIYRRVLEKFWDLPEFFRGETHTKNTVLGGVPCGGQPPFLWAVL